MVVNSMLLYGIIIKHQRFFFPYFCHAPVIIIVAVSAVIYFLCLPDYRINALFVSMFIFGEVKFLYAAVSYYKQLSETHSLEEGGSK